MPLGTSVNKSKQMDWAGLTGVFEEVDTQTLFLGGTQVTATGAELNVLDGVTATATEINRAADASGFSQELTATGAVTSGVQSLELNHISTIIAATIADAANHAGFFYVVNTSASGTAAHTLTLTSGTFDGTNNIATLDAPAESLLVFFDGSGDGRVILNTGSVSLST